MNAVAWTDKWQAYLVAGQLLVLVVAAFFAWRQVKKAREPREERTGPFVVVDFDVEGGRVANWGGASPGKKTPHPLASSDGCR